MANPMFSKFDDSELIVNLFFLKGEHVDIKFICKYEDKIWQTDGETIETVRDYFFGGVPPKSLQMVTAAIKLKETSSLEKSYDQPRQHIQKQRHYFAKKGPSSQGLVFPVAMYGCES